MKRAISEGGRVLVETWTQPGPSPSMPPQVTVIRLTRRGESLVHDASDEKKTFVGSVVFVSGLLDAWTCTLTYSTVGTVTGSGRVSAEGVRTSRTFQGPRLMLTAEELRPIAREVYDDEIASMRPPKEAE